MAKVATISSDNQPIKAKGYWQGVLYSLLRNRSAIVGMILLGLLISIAFFAPIVATHDPLQSMIGIEDGKLPRKPPCIPAFGCEEAFHLMGLDLNARDVFSRVVYGARITIPVGVYSVIIAVLIGMNIGLVAGYFGGWVDNILMRIMDVLLAFPGLLLAISFITIRGPGLQNALLAISLVFIPAYARVTRSAVLGIKENEYVMAARAMGATSPRIIFLHILPMVLSPLIVQATLGIGTAIIDAAALSFLGLGAQPPDAEWGQMLSEGRAYIFTAPHIVFFPGIMITITVLAFNLLGDGLRDALDPRLKRT
jgi:peptide/nickel transport system permease protein